VYIGLSIENLTKYSDTLPEGSLTPPPNMVVEVL